jgi:hypothetical protein
MKSNRCKRIVNYLLLTKVHWQMRTVFTANKSASTGPITVNTSLTAVLSIDCTTHANLLYKVLLVVTIR